jgi:hypothetical protein
MAKMHDCMIRWGRFSGALLMLLASMAGVVVSARAQPVALDVTFKLTDLENHPLPNVPVRLVFGSDPDWQGAGTGKRVVTDAKGEAHFTANVTLDQKLRKVPTNFVGSLVSGPQQTDHLMVAAELEFADFHWLYVADLFRFRQGDTMTDGLSVYTADERGRFVHKAEYDGHAWKMRDLKGLMLTHPGYEIGDFELAPEPADTTGKRWTLKLAFKKSPPPVRR